MYSFSSFISFNFSIDLTMLIKILRLTELIHEMLLFAKFFVDEIKCFVVRGCDAIEVRFDFVETKLLLLTKLS